MKPRFAKKANEIEDFLFRTGDSLFPRKNGIEYNMYAECYEKNTLWLVHIFDNLYCGWKGLMELDKQRFRQGIYDEQVAVATYGLRTFEDAERVLQFIRQQYPKEDCRLCSMRVTNTYAIEDGRLRSRQ